MARILRVVDDEHPVEAEIVVVRRERRPVVVEPERVHRFARVAVAAELVDAGVRVRVVVVLEQPGPEEVAGEAVAFRRRMTVVQMDGDLVSAEARGRLGQAVLHPHDRPARRSS